MMLIAFILLRVSCACFTNWALTKRTLMTTCAAWYVKFFWGEVAQTVGSDCVACFLSLLTLGAHCPAAALRAAVSLRLVHQEPHLSGVAATMQHSDYLGRKRDEGHGRQEAQAPHWPGKRRADDLHFFGLFPDLFFFFTFSTP